MRGSEFNELISFAEIAAHGSLARAAASLGVTGSALSQSLKRLETRLGVRLIERTTRSLSLTAAGEQLVAGIRAGVARLTAATDGLNAHRDAPKGHVRVTVSRTAAEQFMFPRLSELQHLLPNISIEVDVDDRFVDLAKNRFDLGIRRSEFVPDDMVARRLGSEEPFVAVAAPAYLAKHEQPTRPSDLAQSPVRRVLIPKPGSPGKYRALGIPTIADRVVQAAVKSILEPIFEADFFPVSYGFRPGRGVHGALEHLRVLLRPRPVDRSGEVDNRLPYQWAVEGDIKGCFDNIDHHALMNRVRRRIGDPKMNRLVVAFLRAGVLAEDQFSRTDTGTPQGGILSPLLANIALSAIEERYERHVWPRRTPTIRTDPQEITRRANERRTTDRRRGLPIVLPIRYADDFILLVGGPPGPDQQAEAERVAGEEKTALAAFLRSELGLELA